MHWQTMRLLGVFYDFPLDCRAVDSGPYSNDMELPCSNCLGEQRVAWYGTENAEVVKAEVKNEPERLDRS